MTIDELKQTCLDGIDKEAQLEKAQSNANDTPMEYYHRGRKEVWLNIHSRLVHYF